jgi:hypothetical protein
MATNITKVSVESLTVGQEFRWGSRKPARVETVPRVLGDGTMEVAVSRPKPGSSWERQRLTFWIDLGTEVRLV